MNATRMTTLYFKSVFAHAMRRSQVAYGLTSFARGRCSVVVGTSFGHVGVVFNVGALARPLGKTFYRFRRKVALCVLENCIWADRR